MVVAEVLTGIALVKQSVDFIKTHIGTVNDISSIASQIDGMFQGEQECQKLRAKGSGTKVTDGFSVNSVATEVINAKLAAESLREIATLVDLRFGHGTWKGIVDERARRLQEAKQAELAARKARHAAAVARAEELKQIALVFLIIVLMVSLFVGMMLYAANG
jgi:hypothetical protein